MIFLVFVSLLERFWWRGACSFVERGVFEKSANAFSWVMNLVFLHSSGLCASVSLEFVWFSKEALGLHGGPSSSRACLGSWILFGPSGCLGSLGVCSDFYWTLLDYVMIIVVLASFS